MQHFFVWNIALCQVDFFPFEHSISQFQSAWYFYFIIFFVCLTLGSPDGRAFQAFKQATAFCMAELRHTHPDSSLVNFQRIHLSSVVKTHLYNTNLWQWGLKREKIPVNPIYTCFTEQNKEIVSDFLQKCAARSISLIILICPGLTIVSLWTCTEAPRTYQELKR